MEHLINKITPGDARELAKQIPDESIDLIDTDPVYSNIDDYAWLAETAMRVLKPNSACLAWVSTQWEAEARIAMKSTGLRYCWTLYYTVPRKPGALHLYGIFPDTTPCMVFTKGLRKASPYIPGSLANNDHSENEFAWQKNIKVLRRWLTAYSKQGNLVFDPFCGSGSIPVAAKQTGRNFIGFEIEPERAAQAQLRVDTTPMPLFLLDETENQLSLDEMVG